MNFSSPPFRILSGNTNSDRYYAECNIFRILRIIYAGNVSGVVDVQISKCCNTTRTKVRMSDISPIMRGVLEE